MKAKLLLIILVLVLSSGCKPASKVVDVITSAILREVSIEITPNADLGEISLGSEDKKIVVKLKNNSSDPIKELNLNIPTNQSAVKFMPNDDNMMFSPGGGGTCQSELLPGEECTYVLVFKVKKSGLFNIPIELKYLTLIEPKVTKINIKALTGEAANIAINTEKNRVNLGVLEQTDPTLKTMEYEISNVGELSARNVSYDLLNDTQSNIYQIVSNDCPKTLTGGQKCKIKISYGAPAGVDDLAPRKNYSSHLQVRYLKNTEGDESSINTYFDFLASTIEAKIETSFGFIDFDKLVAGNSQTQIFRIINTGFKRGTVKKLIFKKHSLGADYTYCDKAESGIYLNCHKTKTEFPFLIEDVDNCFTNDMAEVTPTMDGGSCVFKVTYWPSRDYISHTDANNFDGSYFSVEYDSHWKDQTKIRRSDEKLITVKADFKTKAHIVLDKISVDGFEYSLVEPTFNDIFKIDIGKIATIKDASLGKKTIMLTIRNEGEEKVVISKVTDGPASGTKYNLKESNLATDSDQINTYYQKIKYDSACNNMTMGNTCKISYDLVPTEQVSGSLQDQLMFDDISNPNEKFKRFYVTYQNGSHLYDDGTAALESVAELRVVLKQISKGVLVFVEPSPLNFGDVVAGVSAPKSLTLKNIGVGTISAIIKMGNGQSIVDRADQDPWPFRKEAAGGMNKDCYNLLYDTAPAADGVVDSAKTLAPGETCILNIVAHDSDANRILTNEFKPQKSTGFDDFTRAYNNTIKNSSEMWEHRGGIIFDSKAITNCPTAASCIIGGLNFKYYDGDITVPNSNFGALTSLYAVTPSASLDKTKFMNLTVNFKTPPYLYLRNPIPYNMGVIIRPTLSYPLFNKTNPNDGNFYPKTAKSYAATSIVKSYFSSADTSLKVGNNYYPIYNQATYSKTLAATLPIDASDSDYPIFFMGSFRATSPATTYSGFIELFNKGQVNATNFTLTPIAPTNAKIAINGVVPTSIAASAALKLEFRVTPALTDAGTTLKQCYTANYKNQIGNSTWDFNFCVYVKILDQTTTPLIEVSTQDFTSDTNTAINAMTVASAPLNYGNNLLVSDATDTQSIFFKPTYDSTLYSHKRIKLKNIGGSTTKVTYYFVNSTNLGLSNSDLSKSANELTTFKSIVKIGATDCGYGNKATTAAQFDTPFTETLAANASCEFYINYKPTTANPSNPTTESVSGYLAIVYDIATNQKAVQYVSLKFRPNRIDKLKVESINGVNLAGTTNVTPWSGNNASVPTPSYPIGLGDYNKATTSGYILSGPSAEKVISNIIISNPATDHRIELLPAGCSVSDYFTTPSKPAQCTPTFTSGYAPIVNNANMFIEANTNCFYIGAQKGFIYTTDVNKKCIIRMKMRGKITYPKCSSYDANPRTHTETIGGKILDSCNPYVTNIPYIVDTTGQDSINIHPFGFIEPDRSTSSKAYFTDVQADSTGKVVLKWSGVTENNSSMGTLLKYIVYYSKLTSTVTTSNVTDIFYNQGADNLKKIDVGSATQATITGLTLGTQYHFRVVAVRSLPAAITYQSKSSPATNDTITTFLSATNIKTVSVPIPQIGQVYAHSLKKLIDLNDLTDGVSNLKLGRDDAIAACGASTNKASIVYIGANTTFNRKLIGSKEWQYLASVADSTTLTSLQKTTHWLSDAAINIFGSLTDFNNNNVGVLFYDYDTSVKKNDTALVMYSTQVVGPSNPLMLYKSVGGMPPLYPGGTLYTDKVTNTYYVRCYVDNPCPYPGKSGTPYSDDPNVCPEP